MLWPIAAAVLSFAFQAGMFASMLLFLAAPVIYLSYRYPQFIKKIALFSFVTSIPISIVTDYVMAKTDSWLLPHSVFGSLRLFNYATVDQAIWLFLYVYFVAIFYEVFLDQDIKEKIVYPRLKFLAILMFSILGIFVIAYVFNPSILNIDYFYLKFGLIFVVLPIIVGLWRIPIVYQKIAMASSYFVMWSLIYELTALSLNQWFFPDKNQFIGFINILGIRFPIEEFIFWILLGAMTTLFYYELFDDDRA